jgi:hypothetical protein
MILNPSIRKFLPLILIVTACSNGPSWLRKDKSDDDKKNSTSAPEVTQTGIPENPAYNTTLVNNNDLIMGVNLTAWLNAGHHGKSMTIAILDNGFGGLKNSLGTRLPPDLVVEKAVLDNESDTPHGTKLTEVIFAMTSGSPQWSPASQHPTLKLYNSNGFTNFSAAVDKAIADRVDMILYSQVWEFGGNFDGRGFINAVVDKATSAGILWVNAAGNYGQSAWQGSLVPNMDQTALLPYLGKYVRLVVTEKSTAVKISLAWNDFADSKEWRTSRDLDLVLLDASMKQVAIGKLIQDGQSHDKDPKYSAHAREAIETTLEPGTYLLRVDIKSQNFDVYSRLRLAADGARISFMDQSADASVMIPADNPSVLTVGASDESSSSIGRTATGAQKPEVVAPSTINFEGGIGFKGSSTAAAVAAAALAVYQDVCGRQSRDMIIYGINSGLLSQQSTVGRGFWMPEGVRCQ